MLNSTELKNIIEAYDTIVVFRHVFPDGDALGSQVGLVKSLKLNYPNKTIYAVGSNDHHYTIYPKMDEIELEGLKFLSIVVDTANRPRVDDERYTLGDKIVKIDHHPEVDPYGDLQLVNTDRGSACEIVTDLLRDMDMQFNDDIATTLLSGIITDTLRFSIEKTSYMTLESAAYLMRQGANISELNNKLSIQPKEIFKTKAMIMNAAQLKGGLSYAILNSEDLKALPVDSKGVKSQVNSMAGIEDFKIWALFVQDADGTYEGSLRARYHTVNDVAESYGGGGHRLASGVSKLSLENVYEMIETLSKRSMEDYA